MEMYYTYTQSCDTIFGCGTAMLAGEKAVGLGVTKAMIVTDKGVYDNGLTAPVEDSLKTMGIPCCLQRRYHCQGH